MNIKSVVSSGLKALVSILFVGTASASIFIYTLTDNHGVASLGSASIVGPYTVTLTGNTSNIQTASYGGLPGYTIIGPASITIPGIGTAAITDQIGFSVTFDSIFLSDFSSGSTIANVEGPFGSYPNDPYEYNFQTPLSITGYDTFGLNYFNTTAGVGSIFGEGQATFTATPSATTPEPSYITPIIVLALLLKIPSLKRRFLLLFSREQTVGTLAD